MQEVDSLHGKQGGIHPEEELQGHANRGRPAWVERTREAGDQGKKPEMVEQKLGSMVGSKLIMFGDGVFNCITIKWRRILYIV